METELLHTRALLSYLFTTFKSRSAPSPLTRAVQSLSLRIDASELRDATAELRDASDSSEDESGSVARSVASSAASEEEKIDTVLQLLQDEDIEEEDRPEKLQELLQKLLVEPPTLEPLVLALLHRYREDCTPSGTPLPPLPHHSASGATTPSRPSMSRSSSFLRVLPSLSAVRNQGVSLSSNVSSSSSALSSPNHSPWSSPRLLAQSLALSAQAVEFKFSAGASEFRPGGFGTPIRSRSPITTAHQAQAKWASSPLGTPKYNGSPASSAASLPYFANGGFDSRQVIAPRLPWAEPFESQSGSSVGGEYVEGDDYQYDEQEGANWDPFELNEAEGEGEYDDGYSAQTDGGAGGGGGLGGMGNYLMTPFDVLHSVFAGSDITAAILEEALVMSGWDVDQAIEYIVETVVPNPNSNLSPSASHNNFGAIRSIGLSPMNPNSAPTSPMPQNRTAGGASGSRPHMVSRDSFDGYSNGGRGSPMNGNGGGTRWPSQQQQGSRPSTPGSNGGDAGRAIGGRVCRYYLSGACLRSDCHFSHDVGKAVCKFWLRGHCLKGDRGGGGGSRCDFLHSIPPVMRADFADRAALRRSELAAAQCPDPGFDGGREDGPDLDFPSLGEAPRSRRLQPGNNRTATRFSSALKSNHVAAIVRPTPLVSAPPRTTVSNLPRASARLTLRPPALLPTLPTGAQLATLYSKYRSSFLELGANRNRCLAQAAECWRRGDGAGARKLSREAQDFNRQVAIEGSAAARTIVQERGKCIKDAIAKNEGRAGSTDDVADRQSRGKDLAGGVILGVASAAVVPQGSILDANHRTEVAIDLHGLHGDESVPLVTSFLQQLEHDRFAGLAYIIVGQAKHTGASDAERGAASGRLRLESAVTEFLLDSGYAHRAWGGVICVDALR